MLGSCANNEVFVYFWNPTIWETHIINYYCIWESLLKFTFSLTLLPGNFLYLTEIILLPYLICSKIFF